MGRIGEISRVDSSQNGRMAAIFVFHYPVLHIIFIFIDNHQMLPAYCISSVGLAEVRDLTTVYISVCNDNMTTQSVWNVINKPRN